MTAAEYGEWWAVWQWAPWAEMPNPPPVEQEVDPMAFAGKMSFRHG